MKKTNIGCWVAIALVAGLTVGCSRETPESLLAAARQSLERNERSAAVIHAKNALQLQPENPEARFVLALALVASGDAQSAMLEFAKAEELGMSAERLALDHARALLAQGQAAKVIDKYRGTHLKDVRREAQLQAALASAYWAVGKRDVAWAAMDTASKADPTDPSVKLTHARMQVLVSALDKAQAEVDELLKQHPSYAEGWVMKAELLSRQSAPDEQKLAAYREALKYDKNSIAAHSGVATVLMQTGDLAGAAKELNALRAIAPKSGQTGYVAALLSMRHGKLDEARDQLQQLLKRGGDNVPILHLAGAVEFQRGSLLQADSLLSKALSLSPESVDIRLLLARVHLRAGDAEKALSMLQPLANAPKVSPELYPLLAEAYLQTGDTTRAEQMLAKSVNLNPSDVGNRVALLVSRLQRKYSDADIAELRTLSRDHASTAPDLALVSVSMREKRYDQAREALEALAVKIPKQPLPDQLRGELELARGDRAAARRGFEASLAKDATYFPAVDRLANLDLEEGRVVDAEKRYAPILKGDPKNLRARVAAINLRSAQQVPKEKLAEELTQLVKEVPTAVGPRVALVQMLISEGKGQGALTIAQEGVSLVPDRIELLLALASASAYVGDFNQAMASVNKAITQAPKSAQPLLVAAEIYSRRGDFKSATQSIKKALAVKPGDLPALSALYAVEKSTGHLDEAAAAARQMQANPVTKALGLLLEGDIELKRNRPQAATVLYRKALDLAPDTSFAIKLHRTLLAAGNADDAAKFSAQWLQRNPKDSMFIHHLGDVALKAGRLDEAFAQYAMSLERAPGNASAANNLAWISEQRGKLDEALRFGEQANRLVPENPQYMDTLAGLYAKQGQLDKAIDLQKRSVELSPKVLVHRLHLAKMYLQAGKQAQAKTELERIATSADTLPAAVEARVILSGLK